MKLVVDASVAIKFVVKEPGNEQARALFDRSEILVAPDWLMIEAASTMWKKVKRSELLMLHAERHLENFPEFFGRLYPSAPLVSEAFSWSLRLRHSVYDCIYLALALREGCKLISADEKFCAGLSANGLADRFEALL